MAHHHQQLFPIVLYAFTEGTGSHRGKREPMIQERLRPPSHLILIRTLKSEGSFLHLTDFSKTEAQKSLVTCLASR